MQISVVWVEGKELGVDECRRRVTVVFLATEAVSGNELETR